MRRRDLLTGGFALAALWGLLPRRARARSPREFERLPRRLEPTVAAVAAAMVGPTAAAALAAGDWEPAADLDDMLGRLPPDQARLICLALRLLETWPPGPRRFSRRDLDERQALLERWRLSENELQRMTWGVLHAACCSSFSGREASWTRMGYLGPVVGSGRLPGRTVDYEWDEVVP